MYMDGVDYMPTSRSVLYGYHFKSIAAAGPIVGVITAANIWGWVPSIIWLILGVSFIGWAADYSAVMISVRNDGNSLSAISYKLIAPRTRTILFIFIFFYLLLLAAAFLGIMAALMDARPDVPLGILVLAIMGLLGGQMLYRWKVDVIPVTIVIVVITLAAMVLGPAGQAFNAQGALAAQGPVGKAVVTINNAVNSTSGGQAVLTTVDPTKADPRLSNPNLADAKTGLIKMMPSYLLWRCSC
jgi:carbon starvation protein